MRIAVDRSSAVTLMVLLAAFNLAAWAWALIAFRDYPVLLGTALLAYGFGLRHAIDADHIAAIDNVTRKLMREGQAPLGVGLFFSLGHSTVVVALSVAIAVLASAAENHFGDLKAAGGLVGTGVSAAFLFLIAGANLVILQGVYRSFKQVRDGGRLSAVDLDQALAGQGPLTRLLGRLFRMIGRSWHMYPLGVLFGLGFDTATEIGLLGISAAEAAEGLPVWSILVFPALFAAGMSLLDTLDGLLMVGAYQWALVRPLRKLYYNLTITGLSVVVAVLVGSVEVLGLLAERLALRGPFWDTVGSLTGNFGLFGIVIVALFAVSWVVSLAVYRLKGYDRLDATA
ncbi:MAG TPA: HoxN/HupN/NixA family nickel/cobalt transporter [Rhodospirillaceae bacterium]|nr:HoxN/HupN/NixA family nickel/cobalt transporter [Rhodospirillaceae bacterium]